MRNVAAPRRRAFASVPKGMASFRLLRLLLPLLGFSGMPERASAAEPPALGPVGLVLFTMLLSVAGMARVGALRR